MEKYIDESVIIRKQQILRAIAVVLMVILFPFICLGLGIFYTMDNFQKIK